MTGGLYWPLSRGVEYFAPSSYSSEGGGRFGSSDIFEAEKILGI